MERVLPAAIKKNKKCCCCTRFLCQRKKKKKTIESERKRVPVPQSSTASRPSTSLKNTNGLGGALENESGGTERNKSYIIGVKCHSNCGQNP